MSFSVKMAVTLTYYQLPLFQIALLRDILGSWRDETNKKPCKISYEDSLRELGVDPAKLTE